MASSHGEFPWRRPDGPALPREEGAVRRAARPPWTTGRARVSRSAGQPVTMETPSTRATSVQGSAYPVVLLPAMTWPRMYEPELFFA